MTHKPFLTSFLSTRWKLGSSQFPNPFVHDQAIALTVTRASHKLNCQTPFRPTSFAWIRFAEFRTFFWIARQNIPPRGVNKLWQQSFVWTLHKSAPIFECLLTFWITSGVPKSFPPCRRNPQGCASLRDRRAVITCAMFPANGEKRRANWVLLRQSEVI